MRAAPEKSIGGEQTDCLHWSAVGFAAWHKLVYHVPVILAGICVRKSNSKLRSLRHSHCQGKSPGWIAAKLNAAALKGQF